MDRSTFIKALSALGFTGFVGARDAEGAIVEVAPESPPPPAAQEVGVIECDQITMHCNYTSDVADPFGSLRSQPEYVLEVTTTDGRRYCFRAPGATAIYR